MLLITGVLTGVVSGLIVNAVSGRSFSDIFRTLRASTSVRLRHWLILAIGIAGAATVGLNLEGNLTRYTLAVSLICICVATAANDHITGMRIIAVGAALNLIPLLANGYLPVDPDAVIAAGIVEAEAIGRVVLGAGRRLQIDGDLAVWLGPVIGIPWVREVVSFGDLIVAAGITNVVWRLYWPTDPALRAPDFEGATEGAGNGTGDISSSALGVNAT